ncbi:NUDIX domain-containing protein [Candidatus Dependentiae bacterium]|nr:NUDIX domain-containing protein [Candidatus Dependentiae bacterium]
MDFVERNSIRVILINDKKELLLMCVEDKKTTSADGTYSGPFWVLVGGGMEPGEDIKEAAFREIHEEAGLAKEDVELGPIVWHDEVHMVLAGTPTHINEQYIVAKVKTNNNKISNENFTDWEKEVVRKVDWFSLEQIRNIPEIVYPLSLMDYLPDALDGKYPEKPININPSEVKHGRK